MNGATDLALVVMAAGKGTRMRSRTPKVLHPVCGRPILLHQIALARALKAARVIVVHAPGDTALREALAGEEVELAIQAEPRGTGDAALCTRERLEGHPGPILVMNGDHPLFRPETLGRMLEVHDASGADLTLLTARFSDPASYGRIARDPGGAIERIVEVSEATPEVRAIDEVNLGVYLISAPLLFDALARLAVDNRKPELFLTDVVELLLRDGRHVASSEVEDEEEALGVNDRSDLARAETSLRRRIAEHWMREGVTFLDPLHTYVDADVEIGADTVLEPGCVLRGATRIGSGCRIAAGAVIEDSTVGDDVWVKPHCFIEQSVIGSRCEIGPSAHFRPAVTLEDDVRIGNFVEVKNSHIGRGTKADHLSYIGDADLGERVSIGCGAITVNYDSEKKNRTVIEDGAFVGCNANLIAPVRIRRNAYVAAGSTVTTEIPEGALAVARARQRNIEGWRARRFGDREEG